jgi:DNA-binding Lrp family transcriptional regulator
MLFLKLLAKLLKQLELSAMALKDKKEFGKALEQLKILQKVKITEFPSLYEQWIAESPQIKLSSGLIRPLLDVMVSLVLSGGVNDFKEALSEAGEVTLEELVRLCELSVKQVTFDRRDSQIVQLLFQDPLQTRMAIAEKLSLHRSTIAQRILRLTWTNAIRSYPLPDWQYFGITKVSFRYTPKDRTPKIDEKHCYSRWTLWEDSGLKILDNWNCPVGQEDELSNQYQKMEKQGLIANLETRKQLSLEKMFSMAYFLNTRPSIPQIGLEIKRRLEGRIDGRFSQELPLLQQRIAFTHQPSFDDFDVRLLQELWLDFLLSRSRAEVAQALGVSAPTVSRRIQKWVEEKIVRPSIQFGFQGTYLRQGPAIMDIGLRFALEKREVLYDLLALFPKAFLYEIEIKDKSSTGKRFLECIVSVFPEMRGIVFQLPSDLGVGSAFKFEMLSAPSALELFDTFDHDKAAWQKIGTIFKDP